MNDKKWRVLVVADDARINGSYIQDGIENERMRFTRENDDGTFMSFESVTGEDENEYFTWSIRKGENWMIKSSRFAENMRHKSSDLASDCHPPSLGWKLWCGETFRYNYYSNLEVIILPSHKGVYNLSNIASNNRSAVMGDAQCAKETYDNIERCRLTLVSDQLRSEIIDNGKRKDEELADQKIEIDKLKKLIEEQEKTIATQATKINDQATNLNNIQAGLEGFVVKIKTDPNHDTIKTEHRQNA